LASPGDDAAAFGPSAHAAADPRPPAAEWRAGRRSRRRHARRGGGVRVVGESLAARGRGESAERGAEPSGRDGSGGGTPVTRRRAGSREACVFGRRGGGPRGACALHRSRCAFGVAGEFADGRRSSAATLRSPRSARLRADGVDRARMHAAPLREHRLARRGPRSPEARRPTGSKGGLPGGRATSHGRRTRPRRLARPPLVVIFGGLTRPGRRHERRVRDPHGRPLGADGLWYPPAPCPSTHRDCAKPLPPAIVWTRSHRISTSWGSATAAKSAKTSPATGTVGSS